MRLPPTRRQRNRERIRALFESIRLNVPQSANHSWLDALERDALRVRPGWRQRFDAWLEGMEQARLMLGDSVQRDANYRIMKTIATLM